MAVNETYVQAALIMDRDSPLGNSPGTSTDTNGRPRRRLHVKVENRQTEPVPVYITNEFGADPFNEGAQTLTDPGQEKLIYETPVVSMGTELDVKRCDLSCRIEGVMTAKIGSTLVGTARTSAASPNCQIQFDPYLPVGAGEKLTIYFKARTGSPTSDVEAFVKGFTQPI